MKHNERREWENEKVVSWSKLFYRAQVFSVICDIRTQRTNSVHWRRLYLDFFAFIVFTRILTAPSAVSARASHSLSPWKLKVTRDNWRVCWMTRMYRVIRMYTHYSYNESMFIHLQFIWIFSSHSPLSHCLVNLLPLFTVHCSLFTVESHHLLCHL